jgi:hypothetical protein
MGLDNYWAVDEEELTGRWGDGRTKRIGGLLNENR